MRTSPQQSDNVVEPPLSSPFFRVVNHRFRNGSDLSEIVYLHLHLQMRFLDFDYDCEYRFEWRSLSAHGGGCELWSVFGFLSRFLGLWVGFGSTGSTYNKLSVIFHLDRKSTVGLYGVVKTYTRPCILRCLLKEVFVGWCWVDGFGHFGFFALVEGCLMLLLVMISVGYEDKFDFVAQL